MKTEELKPIEIILYELYEGKELPKIGEIVKAHHDLFVVTDINGKQVIAKRYDTSPK